MREDTIWRKKASRLFQEMRGRSWLVERVSEIVSEGKRGVGRFGFGVRPDRGRTGHVPGAGGDGRAGLSSLLFADPEVGEPEGVDFCGGSKA